MGRFAIQGMLVTREQLAQPPVGNLYNGPKPKSLNEVRKFEKSGMYSIKPSGTDKKFRYIVFELTSGKDSKNIIRLGNIKENHTPIMDTILEELEFITPNTKIRIIDVGILEFQAREVYVNSFYELKPLTQLIQEFDSRLKIKKVDFLELPSEKAMIGNILRPSPVKIV
jgi:hypothetical protein